MKKILCFPVLFLFLSSHLLNAQRKPLSGKEPSWVTIKKYDFNDASMDHEAEEGYFDILYERQISLSDESLYTRTAQKVITEAGIQNVSEISVNFDPLYEQLTFHTLRIIRGDKIINCLNLSKFKTIQQEKELDMHVYDGSLSSVIFLEDVRKGDIIEYSYTIRGFNPIFKGRYSDRYDLNFTVPIGYLSYKLIVPGGRQVVFKNYNTSLQPDKHESARGTEYEWTLMHVKPIRLQDNFPGWFDPYATIRISEYKDWKEVNEWAMNLFPAVDNLSPELQKKVDEIRATSSNQSQQVLAALRFVQDDVRYMGIEMGESSHRPENPNKIFARRFGDCKDKSYLLCTMLRSLGVEAAPVLINTSHTKAISDWLPSAGIFDHATVRVRLNDKYYWFDPTIPYQRGKLDLISYPDYQRGLVIEPSTDGLATIPMEEPGKVLITEVFDIPDMSGAAKLAVVTHYSGSYADNVRSSFNKNSRYEMQKTYQDFYAKYYKGITADSLEFKDDEKTGEFITNEYYTIEDFWELQDGVKKVSFSPYVIDAAIHRPADVKRTMPYAILWPAKYQEEIEINLPEDWGAVEGYDAIKTSSFTMAGRFYFDGHRTIDIKYDFECLKDYVAAEDIKEYIAALDKRDKDFSYTLSYNTNKNSSVLSTNTSNEEDDRYPIYVGIVVVLLVVGIVLWIRKKLS